MSCMHAYFSKLKKFLLSSSFQKWPMRKMRSDFGTYSLRWIDSRLRNFGWLTCSFNNQIQLWPCNPRNYSSWDIWRLGDDQKHSQRLGKFNLLKHHRSIVLWFRQYMGLYLIIWRSGAPFAWLFFSSSFEESSWLSCWLCDYVKLNSVSTWSWALVS